jgi:plasmid replication initiation protein
MEIINAKKMLVEKRNCLNELRATHMTLQEIRFLCVYLAKINPRDQQGTRRVCFPLQDFIDLMDIQGHMSETYLKNATDSLLQKVVSVPTEQGGFTSFQLFRKCRVYRNSPTSNEWFVEFDAHDEALPYMFNFKKAYITYGLWNVLQLKSINQVRMYEILKQYEKVGERTIRLDELRALIGIEKDEYPRFERFKEKVLKVCQQALREYTDIKFDWEISKRGEKGKILEIRFIIYENTAYTDVLNLDVYLKNYAYQQKIPYYEVEEQISHEMPQNNKSNPDLLDTEYLQSHKLWKYAIEKALKNSTVNNPIPYALVILRSWIKLGYETRNDIARAGEIKAPITNYDLDLVGNGVI